MADRISRSQDARRRSHRNEMYPAILVVILAAVGPAAQAGEDENYCPYFKNRAPSPQFNLKNCTWYKESACCLRKELDMILSGVQPLVGASQECQRQTNYLMCYVCAPDQNTFYKDERLTVCDEFCQNWYSACSKASLKGSPIGIQFRTGAEFCEARKFLVAEKSSGECFFYAPPRSSSGAATAFPTGLLSLAAIVLSAY